MSMQNIIKSPITDLLSTFLFRSILASASADHAVIVWDVALSKISNILLHHSNKVEYHGMQEVN